MDDRGHTGKLRVAIIGAGFSGLSVAHYIRKYLNLQSFVIYDKSPKTAGGAGTWKDNTYPGCACDVPIHLYSLSWARRWNWTEYLPPQPEIQNYLNDIANEHGLHRHIQFGTQLEEARWDDKEQMWTLKLRNVESDDPENAVYTSKHHVVIMCGGPLSQPKMPEGVDLSSFKGIQFHSQDWNHNVTFENKRVAVVGNGCSATQFMPIIARKTKSLTQYVPSPQWYVPRDNPLYTDTDKTLFRYVPGYMRMYRLWLAYKWEMEAFKLQGGEANAATRKAVEDIFLAYMKATAPAKYHKLLTPDYPLGCKRLVFDSNYYQSLYADNVDLKFGRVKSVTETGLVADDGTRSDFDIIVWATGFIATMPFYNTKVFGRSGEELHDRWAREGAPSAYAGLATHDFPNFYMTTGPNTLSGHFSVTTIIEIQAQWIAQTLKMQFDNDVKSFEITKAAELDYNKWIRQKMQGMVWTSNLCNSWFKTKDGLIPTNFPGTTSLYWTRTYYPNMAHMRQVGGTRTVRGTTISKELRKLILKTLAVIGTGLYVLNNNDSIVRKLSGVQHLLKGYSQQILGHARELISFVK